MPHIYETDSAAIYQKSFAIIRAEADLTRFTADEEPVGENVAGDAAPQPPSAEMVATSERFFGHGLLPIALYQPDLAALKAATTRVIPAGGTTSKGEFAQRTEQHRVVTDGQLVANRYRARGPFTLRRAPQQFGSDPIGPQDQNFLNARNGGVRPDIGPGLRLIARREDLDQQDRIGQHRFFGLVRCASHRQVRHTHIIIG